MFIERAADTSGRVAAELKSLDWQSGADGVGFGGGQKEPPSRLEKGEETT